MTPRLRPLLASALATALVATGALAIPRPAPRSPAARVVAAGTLAPDPPRVVTAVVTVTTALAVPPPAPPRPRPAPRAPAPAPVRGGAFPPLVERWRPLVSAYSWPVAWALKVIECESGGDPGQVTPPYGATGLFQILRGPKDPAQNAAVAFSMYRERGTNPWLASRHCWAR